MWFGQSVPKSNINDLHCRFFEVDLGYLLGETDSKTFQMEDAVSFMGLTEEALQKYDLQRATNRHSMPCKCQILKQEKS